MHVHIIHNCVLFQRWCTTVEPFPIFSSIATALVSSTYSILRWQVSYSTRRTTAVFQRRLTLLLSASRRILIYRMKSSTRRRLWPTVSRLAIIMTLLNQPFCASFQHNSNGLLPTYFQWPVSISLPKHFQWPLSNSLPMASFQHTSNVLFPRYKHKYVIGHWATVSKGLCSSRLLSRNRFMGRPELLLLALQA